MILDLRQATIVVAGAFNPAIFSPAWMARHLYEIPEGEEIQGILVNEVGQGIVRPYFKNIAVVAQPQRLLLFIDIMSDEVIDLAEKIFVRICKTLPHTPASAFGINFNIVEENPEADVIDLLVPDDGLEQFGPVVKTEVSSTVKISDKEQMTVLRALEDGRLNLSFNFNYDVSGLQEIVDDWTINIKETFEKTKTICHENFEIEIDEIVYMQALNHGEGL